MSNNIKIKCLLEELNEELNEIKLQLNNVLSRIESMKNQYSDNKLVIYILETIEKDLKGE